VSVRDADGQQRSFAGRCAACFSMPDEPEAVALCILGEITEIRRHEAQLAFMATHDALTGLPNRRMFEDALARAAARANRGKPGALMMLDIDNLKSYNDALGHNQGDQSARQLRAAPADTCTRGRHARTNRRRRVRGGARELRRSMRPSRSVSGCVLRRPGSRSWPMRARLTSDMSGGIVTFDGTEEVRALMDAADAALYEAKEYGRNCLIVRDDRRQPPPARSTPRAGGPYPPGHLNERRFRVHYQPVVRLADGATALLRVTRSDGERGRATSSPPRHFSRPPSASA
jgi:GGDEF domain-containing protein